ncbi:DNA-binding LytR/AlgR family response regulator [Bradyrhizobium sp. GM2.2]
MISDKVRPHHLERKAILYVRQSSAHQVLHNRESSALQYAMRDRLTALQAFGPEAPPEGFERCRSACQAARSPA